MQIPEEIVQRAVNTFHLRNPAHSSAPQLCASGVREALEAVVPDLIRWVSEHPEVRNAPS